MTEELKENQEQKWVPASDADMAKIRTLRPTMATKALVWKDGEEIKGWVSYLLTEPDAEVPHKTMYVAWWEIVESARSPQAAVAFLTQLYAFLKHEKIEVVTFDVRDGAQGADALRAAYERGAKNVGELEVTGESGQKGKLTMFEITTAELGKRIGVQ